MRVLRLHARYIQPGSGENRSAEAEIVLLKSKGIQVETFVRHNADIIAKGIFQTGKALWQHAYNLSLQQQISDICRKVRPDVAHADNLWFALSPSLHSACRREGVPTIQTLRNYRIFCVNCNLLRNGRICEDCLGKGPGRGIFHRCYHDSFFQSALVARMIRQNRKRGTWIKDVDTFLAATAFTRQKFIEGGLPAEKIMVKPNFIEDPGETEEEGKGAVFVGWLAPEKGVLTLLSAWKSLSGIPLNIVGDGPSRNSLEETAIKNKLDDITFHGYLDAENCFRIIRKSAFLVLPSICYETFGRVIIEAFATGRPVITSRLGAMKEIVEDDKTGLLFEPGNADDLAEKARWMADNPDRCREMGQAARREYEEKYTPERNYEVLMEIYQKTIDNFERSNKKS